jgi:hypothetical protein
MTDETKSIWADIGDKATAAWGYVTAWPKAASFIAGALVMAIAQAFL